MIKTQRIALVCVAVGVFLTACFAYSLGTTSYQRERFVHILSEPSLLLSVGPLMWVFALAPLALVAMGAWLFRRSKSDAFG